MPTAYPSWVMSIGVTMIVAGVLPIPAVYLLRRFQILKVDLDIHQGSIRRNETTASTKQMMDDDDVSKINFNHAHSCSLLIYILYIIFLIIYYCHGRVVNFGKKKYLNECLNVIYKCKCERDSSVSWYLVCVHKSSICVSWHHWSHSQLNKNLNRKR